jgi:beta-galactosidase
MKGLGREFLESSYIAETALSFDQDCDWALQIQPGHAKLTYRDQLMKWYGAVAAANTGADLIHLDEDLSKYKAVFAAVQYVLTQRQANNIRSYVQNGGMFVAGFRLGVKDENSQIVNMPLPGLLRDVMGVTLKDYVPIYSEKVGVSFESQLAGPEAKCGFWSDLLVPDTATTLAKYTGPYEGAAITINNFGKGKAVYVGADLDPETLSRVLRILLAISGSKSDFVAPTGVELTRRRAGQKEWFFLLNHATQPQTVTLPGKFKSVLSGESFDRDLHLKPYEVAILQRA